MNRVKLKEYLEKRCYITKDNDAFIEGSIHCSINDVLDAMEDSHKEDIVTEVYVINCNTIEEMEDKTDSSLTDEEFILFGTKYSVEEFQNEFNSTTLSKINMSTDYIRFIERTVLPIEVYTDLFLNGFTIHFLENPNLVPGVGYLLLHSNDMPKKNE